MPIKAITRKSKPGTIRPICYSCNTCFYILQDVSHNFNILLYTLQTNEHLLHIFMIQIIRTIKDEQEIFRTLIIQRVNVIQYAVSTLWIFSRNKHSNLRFVKTTKKSMQGVSRFFFYLIIFVVTFERIYIKFQTF